MEVLTSKKYSIKEISEELSVSKQTLRNWINYFSIPVSRDEFGRRIFTEKTFSILSKIQAQTSNGAQIKNLKHTIQVDFDALSEAQNSIEILSGKNDNFRDNPFIDECNEKQFLALTGKIEALMQDKAKLAGQNEILKLKNVEFLNQIDNNKDEISTLQERLKALEEKEERFININFKALKVFKLW